ncbi:type II secretion system F family protein [Cellulomonas algicola]|uniref:type II secretion system F family protein n=1 Tax=Cellulomonas algicola TaxID=2071633 RepID=UPI0027E0C55E|nr:type II secretion protein F [Cellulomonas algicola]
MDLVGVLHDTAARLRSGAPPGTAWSDVLGRPGIGDVPTAEDVVGGGAARRREDVARARAVVAAAQLAADLGAPLADVLEGVAGAVAADEEHDADVATALAGPRATARVLLVLPVAGVLLGTLLGADPLGVLTSGGVGTGCALLGAGLLVLGRWWTGRLLARTVAAGRLAA